MKAEKNDTIYAIRQQYIEKNKWKTKHIQRNYRSKLL